MKQFKALLESELLSEETKQEITKAFEELKESVRNELETEYATKQVEHNRKLSQRVVEMVEERVKTEMEELREDVQKAKNMEPEYARKLTKFKRDYQMKLRSAMEKKIVEMVTKEFAELRADLLEAKQNAIGRQVFEALKNQVAQFGLSEKDLKATERLAEAEKELSEKNAELDTLKRERVLEGLLKNLKGSRREVMATILENVSIDKLETRYNEALPSVMEKTSEEPKPTADNGKKRIVIESDEGDKAASDAERLRLRRFAGIGK